MRGISAVIATILLLVMVVVITAGVFYFFRGTMGTATTKGTEAVTGAITQTEVEANIKLVNYVNKSEKVMLTIQNSLSRDATLTRVDFNGESYTVGNKGFLDCSNLSQALTSEPTLSASSVVDVCLNATYVDVSNLTTKTVILYVKVDNKIYTIKEYLS